MADRTIYTGSYDLAYVQKLARSYEANGFSALPKWDDQSCQYDILLTKKEAQQPREFAVPEQNSAEAYPTIGINELARYMGLSDSALRGWRAANTGPAAYKFSNRVFYHCDDVERYLHECYVILHKSQEPLNMQGGKPFIMDIDAEEILGVNRDVIVGWRTREIGPNYFRFGSSIRYRPEDVEAYAQIMRDGYGPSVRASARRPRPNEPVNMTSAPVATSSGIQDDAGLSVPAYDIFW